MKKFLLSTLVLLLTAFSMYAQVTTSSLTGTVTDERAETLPGATVIAVHNPSGSRYSTSSNAQGKFTIPGMRVGGPYTITFKFIGYKDRVVENVSLNLGTVATVNASLDPTATELVEVMVTATAKNAIISADRTGAATNVGREAIASLPTIGRTINDFTRLTPQANGSSFGGQDNRLNNITVDGSLFNNSFGLSGQPGGRTGVAPISLDAIDQIQVNIAPYDVRQSGFVGAGVNAVTKSGNNNVTGTFFYNVQSEQFVGDKTKDVLLTKQNYNTSQYGLSLGGPIVKNKLFFFVNAEKQKNNSPASSYLARENGQVAGNNISSVSADDLSLVSSQLASIGYQTGIYQNYNFQTKGDRFITRLDWNISDKNKFSIRYNYLNSSDDKPVSNSSSLGFGSRFNGSRSMSFRNSNYMQTEKIHSVVGELNSTFGKFSNTFIAGYTYQNEDRGSAGDLFPLIEIQNSGSTYITAGTEPFTPNNKLKYSTYQASNNLTYYANKHTLTGGLSVERLQFENVFFPGSQSVYVFNSLGDFNTALNSYKANNNLTTSPVSLRRFQLRFSALPGGAEPVQPTKVWYTGAYVQDEIQANANFKITAGLRADMPIFDKTGYFNANVPALTFKNGAGEDVHVSTDKLPASKILLSPRVGFNYNVNGESNLQIRGGSGIFTGRPAFVWISNQIGNNGVLSGFESIDNTTTRPFNPSPAKYIPANPSAGLPTTYELNVTDPDFKFPQVWRSNLAFDKKLFGGLVGTAEFLYSKDINAVDYQNINQEAATGKFTGPDDRPTYPGLGLSSTAFNNASRINDNITALYYLTNTDKGYSYSATASIERPYRKGFFFKAAYTYGQAKNVVNAGSNASGSYNNNAIYQDANNAPLGFAADDQRHRVIATASYKKSYNIGSSEISFFGEGRQSGNFSYIYSGDLNGDGNRNDLLYIPNNANELKFVPRTITTGGVATVFTADQQAQLFEQYINQDEYLSANRGKYAERNAALFPWFYRADAAFIQEFNIRDNGKNNILQFRFDVFNVTNLINKNWGSGKFVNQTQILSPRGVDATGTPTYQYNNFSGSTPVTSTFGNSTSIGFDTYRAQFGFRYIFN
ncbi:MAG: carboxypeptidase regulatory-like domain-containing protein [Daejeonella sp.]